MTDQEQIRDVLARYCRGVDRADSELLRSVYHPGATDDHGLFVGPAETFVDQVLPELTKTWSMTMHTLGQSLIELDGDQAAVETYFVAYHRRPADGASWLDTFGGRYVDRFERRAGEWRIAHRTVVHEWSKLEELTMTFPADSFTQGQRNREDLAYGGAR